MEELLFGTAGIPLSTKAPSTIHGISRVKELGLGAMELEFVRSINISEKSAPEVKSAASSNGIALTCHAPYFINLNSADKAKLHASKHRIIESARIASLCGCQSLTFHAAFYQGMDKEEVYSRVKESIKEIVAELKSRHIGITIRPELTGKPSQFGDLKEVIQLSQDIDNVLPCIDFAHLHAREGKYNSYNEFCSVLSEIEKGLGKKALQNMHIHMAGINYSEKGERNHLNLKDSDMNYKALLKAFKEYGIKGIVISESPNIEGDASLLKDTFYHH